MDFRSMLDQVKSAFVIGKGNTFLHGGQPERQQPQDYYEPQQAAAPGKPYASGYQAPYQQPAAPYQADPFSAPAPEQSYYQQAPQQQPAYQQQPQAQAQPYYYYQQPQQQQQGYQQQGYQQPAAQPVYQQPQQQQQQQQNAGFQTQIDPFGQERNRRGGRHRDGAPEAPIYAQPQPENLVQFPAAAQQPQAEQPAGSVDAYVINVFNLNSCRQAMSCLRRGQCTLIVMDQLFDKAEIRRYVDMLTGACYALNGTMTRLSAKIGFYIMAPAGMTVYTDPTTSNANSARPATQAPGFGAASAGTAPRQPGDFSAQSAYSPPAQMNFSSRQAETSQSSQASHQPGYQQAAAQDHYQQPVYQQAESYQSNAYPPYQEDQQRYAQ